MPLLQDNKPWVGLHGIWDDGNDTIIKLLKEMGVLYYTPKYDVNPFSARMKDTIPFLPYEVLGSTRPNLVCHSAGCLMAQRLMEQGHTFDKVFFFSSAMDRDFEFNPKGYNKIYNIFYPKDRALFFGAMLLLHPFGNMGRKGYNGKSPNIENIEASFSKTELLNHSNYFLNENIKYWANFCLTKSQ